MIAFFNWLRSILRSKRTPRLIQMEAVECGAAALGIILAYYKRFVSLEELRLTCGVSRDGVSAYQMIQAARYYGMEADGYKGNWRDLPEIPMPAILFWNFNHFIVLERISGERAYINDPATGPKKITLSELSKRFSGYVITLKPSPSFRKEGREISLTKRMIKRFVSAKDALVYLLGIEGVLVLFGLILPAASKIFIDTFLNRSPPSWKKEFILFLVAATFLSGIVAWFKGRFLNRLKIRLSMKSSAQFLHYILSLPLSFFSQRYPGDLIHRILLNIRLAVIFTEGGIVNTINLLLITLYGIILFTYSVSIALVGIGTALFNMLLLYGINRMRTNAYALLQQEEAKSIGVSLDSIENIETMKSVSASSFFFSRIAGHYTNTINAAQNIGKKDIWLLTLSSFSSQLSTIILLAVGSWLVMSGEFSIGMLYAFHIIMNAFLSPFQRLVEFGADLQSFKVDIARLDDVMRHQSDPLTQMPNEPKEKLKGMIELKNVIFAYAPLDPPFIKTSFKIFPHEVVGIVGKVGSGKSTLAKILASLYLPRSGEVLYDGKNFRQLSRKTLAQSIAIIDQEIKLFAATLFENIALWDNAATEEAVQAAAKKAKIHEEILELPLGYQTLLLEEGANFSSGQRQRIELARAFFGSPSILILDEALNGVDPLVEEKILEEIRDAGFTTFLITHRLSTVRQCDRILLYEKGEIAGEGTHADLLAHPLYQEIIKEI